MCWRGRFSRTGRGAGSSLSSSLTQQCTCDHSDILFESIKVLGGGSGGREQRAGVRHFDPGELGVARSPDSSPHVC